MSTMYQTTYECPYARYHATFRRLAAKRWSGWLYRDGIRIWGANHWTSKIEAREEIDWQAKLWRATPTGHRRIV